MVRPCHANQPRGNAFSGFSVSAVPGDTLDDFGLMLSGNTHDFVRKLELLEVQILRAQPALQKGMFLLVVTQRCFRVVALSRAGGEKTRKRFPSSLSQIYELCIHVVLCVFLL